MSEKPTRHTVDDVYKLQWIGWIITVLLVVGCAYAGINLPALPPMPGAAGEISAKGPDDGYTNFTGLNVVIPTTFATGTPGVLIESSALGAALDVSVAGTSALVVDKDGNTTISGTCTGCEINSATGLRITQPTAAATATPALAVNSLAAGAKLLEVADASTPVFSILNGGAVSRTGDDTMTGDLNVTGAGKVAAATAVATATPAFVVDSAGVSNLFEVRDAATPVFAVNDGGVVVGSVLQYGSSGDKLVTTTESITGTVTVAHGLTTVTWALCVLGEDPTSGGGEAAHVSVAVSGNTVTAKVWQDDFVTEATETEVDVHCLVVGTP